MHHNAGLDKGWCDTELSTNEQTRKEKTEAVETLHAEIDQLEASISKLTEDISELTKAVAELVAAMSEATTLRQDEKAKNEQTIKDFGEAQAALAQALSMVETKKAIDIFLQNGQDPEGLDVSAPEAHGYEFQSHGVIEMLEKFPDKFIDERTTLEKAEMNGKHVYDMSLQDITAQIDQATQDRVEKSEIKAKKLQAKADAQGDLTDTTTTMEADEKYLSDLTATCEQKASDFESRPQLRAEEIEAITKAMEIISGSAVSGNADKFVDERTALEKEEMNGKHAYDMLVQDFTAQIDQATQDRE